MTKRETTQTRCENDRSHPDAMQIFRPGAEGGRLVYLDHQATTPLDPRVFEAMLPWLRDGFGNPHARTHRLGEAAHAAVEAARCKIARLIGADSDEIIFQSGATEAC